MRPYSTARDGDSVRARSWQIDVICVRAAPRDRPRGLLVAGGRVIPCALGRSGISAFKREGDGATPRAAMRLIGGYFRPDKGMPRRCALPLAPIDRSDGWCDAPGDANYNRPVRLPFRPGHERMWRADRLYDAVIVLDWNFRRRARNRGSAIFLHVARPGFAPTEGCVAISPAAMRWLLPRLSPRTVLKVVG